MKIHVTFAGCDDWEAMYVNGRLVYQTHTIPRFIISSQIVGTTVESWSTIDVDDDWVEQNGEFPANLSDIPNEVRK